MSKTNKSYNCKFLHFRYITKDGAVESRGGRTVAYIEDNGTVRYAMSKCDRRDNFNFVTAHNRAAGRLESSRFRGVFQGTYKEFVAAMEADAAKYGLERKYSGKPKAEKTGLASCAC